MQTLADLLQSQDAITAAIMRRPPEPVLQFHRVTLEQLDTAHHAKIAQAVDAARQWDRRRQTVPGASLVLVASPVGQNRDLTGYGCGKTHVARACLHTECYWLDGAPVAPAGNFFDANAIIQRLDADTPAISAIGRARIVVVDDVGTEQTIPYTIGADQAHERQTRYFKLINFCYQNGVALILTGNLSIKALSDRIGGRAWSRLQEMAPKGFVLDLTGVPDWRRKHREAAEMPQLEGVR